MYHALVQKQQIATHDREASRVIIPSRSPEVSISVEGENLLSVPNVREMTLMANKRREVQKTQMKKAKAERGFTWDVLQRMRPHWFLLGVGVTASAVAGTTAPVFSYFLGKEIVAILTPNTDDIAPSAFSGANLYALLFGMCITEKYIPTNINNIYNCNDLTFSYSCGRNRRFSFLWNANVCL